jgi:hypothetical protein
MTHLPGRLPASGLLLCLATAILSAPQVGAQQLVSQRVTPSTTAMPLVEAPQIDGEVLGDPAWAQVPPTSGFYQVQPNEGQPATQRTEVWIGYTNEALYIGVVAYDDNPAGIIVADSRRDSSLDETDSFQVIIDGLLDRQNGLVFGTNPAGVEYDAQVTNEGSGGGFRGGGGGFNLNWDTTWEVDAQIGDYGWSAEMEIPFSALRYGSGDEQTWGINFQRTIRRNNEVAYWAPLDRQYSLQRVSEAGTVEGLRPPPRRSLQFTPYALAAAERGGSIVSGTETNEEVGFDLKWGVSPSLTLDATYNTDFAQVEVDDQQVNLDRFSLFFPEKRPFFLENAGTFGVGNPREAELFFSRRIGVGPRGAAIPIEGGARLTGKVGRNTNVGLLRMRTEAVEDLAPTNDFTVARVNQELANRSTVGFMFVERDGDGAISGNASDDYNRTYAVDGRLGIGEDGRLSGWLAQTDTPGLDGDDLAFNLQGNYNSEDWDLSAGFTEVQSNFNPEVGFLARRNYRKYEGRIFRRYRPDDFLNLFEIRPHTNFYRFYDFDGYLQTSYLHVDSHWEFANTMEIHTGVNFTEEGVQEPFEIVDDVWVPIGRYKHEESQLVFQTNQGAPLSFYIQSRIGGFFGGDRVNLNPRINYRIGERFSTELSWNHSDIDLPVPNGKFKVDVGQLRVSYSFTPRILLQTLVQYNNQADTVAANVRFAWLQSANAGLYLVYNEVDEMGFKLRDNARQFIIKYSRILDFFN